MILGFGDGIGPLPITDPTALDNQSKTVICMEFQVYRWLSDNISAVHVHIWGVILEISNHRYSSCHHLGTNVEIMVI